MTCKLRALFKLTFRSVRGRMGQESWPPCRAKGARQQQNFPRLYEAMRRKTRTSEMGEGMIVVCQSGEFKKPGKNQRSLLEAPPLLVLLEEQKEGATLGEVGKHLNLMADKFVGQATNL